MERRIRLGNAPISWGICEIPDWGPQLPWQRVLDEIAQAGYEGTELGPWGYLPTDPEKLKEELELRNLALASAFVPLHLRDEAAYPEDEKVVRHTAAILRELGAREILFSDAGDPLRNRIAGKPDLTRMHGLKREERPGYIFRLERLARMCRDEYGLRACFHSHGGTYIENPQEIAWLLEASNADLVSFCLDTSHVAFGGGDPVAIAAEFRKRLGYVHLKDIDLERLRSLLEEGAGYAEAAKKGVFVPLGQGSLDLPALMTALSDYEGWVIVEQDCVVHPGDDPLRNARTSREYLMQNLLLSA